MKLLKSVIAILIINLTLAASCSKNDDVIATPGGTVSGSWRVSLYWDKKDETSKFSGYTFNFNTNGQLVVTNGSATYTGTWSETSNKFIVNISDPVLGDLTKDWLIEEKTSTLIKLKDDNLTKDERIQFARN
jgi:hypothetical protein